MTDVSMILGEWVMRRGDHVPVFAVVVEDDDGHPVDLTDCRAWLQLRCEDNTDPLQLPADQPPLTYDAGWLLLEAFVYDPPNGVVVYDWPAPHTSFLTVATDQLAVTVHFPDGSLLTAPSQREARLEVRPAVIWPIY
jgi:hypothetical protein